MVSLTDLVVSQYVECLDSRRRPPQRHEPLHDRGRVVSIRFTNHGTSDLEADGAQGVCRAADHVREGRVAGLPALHAVTQLVDETLGVVVGNPALELRLQAGQLLVIRIARLRLLDLSLEVGPQLVE